MTLQEALVAAQQYAVKKFKGSELGASLFAVQVQVRLPNGLVQTVPCGSIVLAPGGEVEYEAPVEQRIPDRMR